MAGIIPRAAQNVRMNVSSPVSVANVSEAGETQRASAYMWGQVTKVAGQVAQHYQQQDQAEQRLKQEQAASQINESLIRARAKADRESKLDGSDYLEKFQENFQGDLDKIYENSDMDSDSRQKTTEWGRKAYSHVATQVQVESAVKKEKANYVRMEGLGDQSANRIRENPNPEMIGAELKGYSAMLDDIVSTGAMSAENAQKVRQAYYSKSATQYIEGLEDRGSYSKALNALKANQEDASLFTELDPKEAKELGFIDSREASALSDKGEKYKVPVMTKGSKVKLTPEMSAVMSGMDPREKANWIDRLKGKALAENAMKLSELNAQVQGFEKVAIAGLPYQEKDVAALKEKVNGNPLLSGQARVRMMDQINTADTMNKQAQLLADTPRGQWNSVTSKFDEKIALSQNHAASFDPKMGSVSSDFAVQANREEAKEKFARMMTQIQKYQDEHPMQYVTSTDKNIELLHRASQSGQPEDIQKYTQAALAKQEYLGISKDNQSVLFNPLMQSQQLKAAANVGAAGEHVDKLQEQYGPYFPKVMAEISKQDPEMAKYQAMAYAPPQVRSSLADAIRNEKAINEAFKKDPSYEAANSTIKNTTASNMEKFTRGYLVGSSNSGRRNTLNAMTEAVELQARREASVPGVNPQSAAQKAYERTINSQFMFSSGGNSQVVVPRQIGMMKMEDGIVDSFLRAHSSGEGLKDFNVKVPAGRDPKGFHDAIARESRWVTNDQMDGLDLKLMDRGTGQYMPVFDKFNKPVSITYEQINLRPSKATVKQNNFLGKMFDSFSLDNAVGLK